MPTEATKHTAQGAKAFAEFFVKTIDWGFATTDGHYMRHYYVQSCKRCSDIADELDNTRAAKHHYLGDRLHFIKSEITMYTTSSPTRAVGRVVSNVDAGTSVNAKGNVINGEAPIPGLGFDISLERHGDRWSVTSLSRVDD